MRPVGRLCSIEIVLAVDINSLAFLLLRVLVRIAINANITRVVVVYYIQAEQRIRISRMECYR